MKQYEITIVADTNDGDYVTSINTISEEDLKTIGPLISAIKEFKPYKVKFKDSLGKGTWTHKHNYPLGEYTRKHLGEKTPREIYKFNDKVFDIFEEYIPYGEYGIHTIVSVEVGRVQKKKKLL